MSGQHVPEPERLGDPEPAGYFARFMKAQIWQYCIRKALLQRLLRVSVLLLLRAYLYPRSVM
jgi:hypothetical protein